MQYYICVVSFHASMAATFMSGIFITYWKKFKWTQQYKGDLRCLTCLRLKVFLQKATKQLTGGFNQYQPKYVLCPVSPSLSAIYYIWDNLMLKKNYALKKYSSSKILYFGDWRLCTSKPAKRYIKKRKKERKKEPLCAISSR